MIEESVRYLAASGRRVIYDAEHFFDGFGPTRSTRSRRCARPRAAAPSVLVLCDTNGGSLPWRRGGHRRARLRARLALPLGIHAHDDVGCAVANSLAAVRAGARRCRGRSTVTASAAATPTSARSIPTSSSRWGSRCLRAGRYRSSARSRTSSPRSPTSRPTSTRPTSGGARSRTRAGVHVAADAAQRRLLQAHRPRAGRQRDPRRRERALGDAATSCRRPRSSASTARGRRAVGCSSESSRSRRRGSPSRRPRPRSRCCCGVARPATSPPFELHRLSWSWSAGERRTIVRRGHDQARRGRRGRAHRGRGRRPGERPRRRAAQGALARRFPEIARSASRTTRSASSTASAGRRP